MDHPERKATVVGVSASALLGAVAGYIDAVCLAKLFGVYPANQSGNAILFGVAVGDADWSFAWRPGTAIAGFVVGVVAAVALGRRLSRRDRARVLLGIELGLLAAVTVVAGDVATRTVVLDGPAAAGLLLVASVAMGVQTEVIRAHAGVALSTTYETGALVTVAEHAVEAAAEPGTGRGDHRRAIVVLLVVVGGYVGGAAAGARIGSDRGAALVVPLAVLLGLLVTAPAWSSDPEPGVGGEG